MSEVKDPTMYIVHAYLNAISQSRQPPSEGPARMSYNDLMDLPPLWEADPVSSAYQNDRLLEETPVLQPDIIGVYKPSELTQRIQLLTGKPVADYSSGDAYQHMY